MNPLASLMTSWREVPSYVLSVNFGSQAVRLGFFERDGTVWRLIQVGSIPSVANWKPADYMGAIREFLKKFPLMDSPTVVTSWRAEVIEKPVVLPQMPASEVRAAIKFAMEHHFSIKVDEYLYDSVESAEVLPMHGMKSRLYYVYAIPRKDAMFYFEILEGISREIAAIVPHSFALTKFLATEYPSDEKDTAYLEIDAESSNFQISRKDRPILSRAVSLGYSVLGPQDPALSGAAKMASGTENADEDEIQRLRPYIERLQHTIQSSIDFYHQQSYAGDIGRLYLCENYGKVPELDRYLELSVEVPVVSPVGAHFDGFEVAPAADAELKSNCVAYAPMLGTFLSWTAGQPNLLPAETVFKNQIRSKKKLLRVAAIAAVILSILINIQALIVMGLEKQKLGMYRSQSQVVQEFQELNAKFLETQRFRSSAASGGLSLVPFMKYLSQSAPAECVILDIDFSKKRRRVDISAVVAGDAPVNAVTVSAKFVSALAQAPFFEKVDLTEGVRDAISGEYRFKITAITHEN